MHSPALSDVVGQAATLAISPWLLGRSAGKSAVSETLSFVSPPHQKRGGASGLLKSKEKKRKRDNETEIGHKYDATHDEFGKDGISGGFTTAFISKMSATVSAL